MVKASKIQLQNGLSRFKTDIKCVPTPLHRTSPKKIQMI